nr:HPr family phosphocarrier protein [Desulfobacterales bacterium]
MESVNNRLLARRLVIKNELGLHARAAARIAEIAQRARFQVWIVKDGKSVDATSILEILSLACTPGTTIMVKIEDKEDIDILNNIAELVEGGFGEG